MSSKGQISALSTASTVVIGAVNDYWAVTQWPGWWPVTITGCIKLPAAHFFWWHWRELVAVIGVSSVTVVLLCHQHPGSVPQCPSHCQGRGAEEHISWPTKWLVYCEGGKLKAMWHSLTSTVKDTFYSVVSTTQIQFQCKWWNLHNISCPMQFQKFAKSQG